MSKIVKLKELIKINNGKDYKHLSNGNIPVYGSGGLMTKVNEYIYDGESILLPRKGTLNNIMYVDEKFWTVDTMYWTTINTSKVYPKYLYCYLSLLDLSSRDSGSTLPSMTFDAYYDLPILLLDDIYQKKIGDLYFTIENKIRINNIINEELEKVAKTIYDYWFLQFDFPDENGKPYKSSGGKMVWNEELKKEIPEGWEYTTISNITKRVKVGFVGSIEKYYCSSKEGFPIIRPSEMEKGGINYNNLKYITNDFYEQNEKSQLHKGDILISRCGKDGIPNIYELEDKAQVLNAVIIEPNNDIIENIFINEALKSSYLQTQIKNGTSGSVQGVINTKIIAQLKILFNKDICKLYVERIKNNYKIININRKKNQQLTSLRDFLLPLLINGQVVFKEE